jgi:homoserine dehydrogenase
MSIAAATTRATTDAYRTTGPSPGQKQRTGRTVHLLGPGAVGRAFLHTLRARGYTLVAVTDSTASIFAPRGLDPATITQWKANGRALRDHPSAHVVPAAQAIALADADIVVDATATDLQRVGWTSSLESALRRGAALVFAAKAAPCERGAEWLGSDQAPRVGFNAVLGGTGRTLLNELNDLQRRCHGIAIVGNASTTAIIEAVEQGASLSEGIADAQRRQFLEPDPEQDLRGDDAAVKLAIVAGLITQRRIDPRTIPCEDIRSLDLLAVRARARRGATTRLIARADAHGALCVRYEEVSRESLLATPCGRVVYEYQLGRDERRLHVGRGLGADETAAAIHADLSTLTRAVVATSAAQAGAR